MYPPPAPPAAPAPPVAPAKAPQTAPTHAVQAMLVEPNPTLTALAAIPLGIALLLTLGSLFNPQFAVGIFHSFVMGAMASAYVRIRKPMAKTTWGQAHVDARGLHCAGAFVDHQDIQSAFVVPRTNGTARVQAKRKGWLKAAMELEVANTDQARWLVQQLGHDVSQRAATFRAASWVHYKWWYSVIAMFGGMALSGLLAAAASQVTTWLLPFALIPMLLAMSTLLIPSRVSVGSDAVVINWLGQERVLSTADIAHVRTSVSGMGRNRMSTVVLTLADGTQQAIPVANQQWESGRAAKLAQRIIDACQLRAAAPRSTVAELQRNQRDAQSWMLALRRLGSGAGAHHRQGGVAPEQLWHVVENVSAPANDRAAAAVALREQLDEPGRARLRIAARTTAVKKLRIALDAAADTQTAEQELLAALEEVEASQAAEER